MDSTSTMWLFRDFYCMIGLKLKLRTLRNSVNFETDVYLLTFSSPRWILKYINLWISFSSPPILNKSAEVTMINN